MIDIGIVFVVGIHVVAVLAVFFRYRHTWSGINCMNVGSVSKHCLPVLQPTHAVYSDGTGTGYPFPVLGLLSLLPGRLPGYLDATRVPEMLHCLISACRWFNFYSLQQQP